MKEEKILSYQLRIDKKTNLPCKGFLSEVDITLEAMQAYVGGYIECIPLTQEIIMIVNENGKIMGMPINRYWISKGKPIDAIVGNILCVRNSGEEFASILESDIPVILEKLQVGIYLGSEFFYPISEDELSEYES